MTLHEVLTSLPGHSWLTEPMLLLRHRGLVTLSKAESKQLHERASEAIRKGDSIVTANHLYAGLVLDEPAFLARLQKDGILRLSRHSYQQEPVASVVASLLAPELGLSAVTVGYLESVANLHQVAKSVRALYDRLRDWLADERETGIKSSLAALDFLFLRQSAGFHLGDKSLHSRDGRFFTIEELAEGFSALLALYGNEFGELRSNGSINPEASCEGFYYAMLTAGSHLAAFREWEFQIDRMGYRLTWDATTEAYALRHPDFEFHRAVELGYIQTVQQGMIKSQEWIDLKDHSFEAIGSRLLAMLEGHGHVKHLLEPVERYRFELPEQLLSSTAEIGEFLREERVYLLGACRDLLTPVDELLAFELGNGLTLRDLFYASRLMHVIRSISAAKLLPEVANRPGVVFQSLVPAFERDTLLRLVGTVIGTEKAEAAVAMMTVDITKHVDVQYQPLIPFGKAILLPANIFANSNIYRNPLVVTRIRLYEDGRVDPLGDSLTKAFVATGAVTTPRLDYSWKGERGEIDVLVAVGGFLFAFECKNSLLPCGVHELMTSLDYIRTAVDQLDRFKKHFEDPAFRRWLVKETGCPIDAGTRLVTGIVMSNRMFMGLRLNGHPVRGNYELEHFLADGTVSMADETRSFWLGKTFTGEDLRRFLEEDVTYQPQWNAITRFTARYVWDDCTVEVERVSKSMLALAEQLGFERAKAAILEQQAAYERARTAAGLPENGEEPGDE